MNANVRTIFTLSAAATSRQFAYLR